MEDYIIVALAIFLFDMNIVIITLSIIVCFYDYISAIIDCNL